MLSVGSMHSKTKQKYYFSCYTKNMQDTDGMQAASRKRKHTEHVWQVVNYNKILVMIIHHLHRPAMRMIIIKPLYYFAYILKESSRSRKEMVGSQHTIGKKTTWQILQVQELE